MQSGTKFTWVNTGTIDVSKITPEIDHNPVPETLTRDGSSVEKEKGFDGSNDSIVLVHGPDGCGNVKKLGRENVVSEESLDSGLKDAGGHESKSVDGGSGCQLGGRLNAGCEGAGNSPGHLEGDSHWSVGEPEAVSNDVSVHCKDQYMRGHDSNDNKSDGLENQAMKIEAQNNASNNQEASWAEVMDMVGSPELCTKRNGDLKSDDCICVREIVTSNAKMISPPENSAVKCDIIGEHDHDSQKVNEKEGEFCVSDLVWGKVRSHPWWPGQIFDPSDASKLAKKYSKPNAYLIAYFGDKTFAWNEEQKLKPFWQHFSEMEKQSGTESFQFAVNCALDEALRRVELALACPCLAKDVYDDLKTQVVKNAGIQEESSRIQGGDRYYTALSFEPVQLVDHITALALSPGVEVDRLKSMITRAQLLAFYRWKGQHNMDEFNLLEGLLENEAAFAGEEKDFTEGVEGGVPDLIHGGLGSPRREMLKDRDSISQKRKGISVDSSSSGKKERRLSDLLSGKPCVGNSKKKTKVNEGTRSVLFSGEKSETGVVVPQSLNVGERIQNAACFLTQLSPITKDANESRPSPPEYVASDFGEMFSYLLMVAVDPFKGPRSMNSIVSCFSDFRNSVVRTCDGEYKKRSASPPEVEENVSCKKLKQETAGSEIKDLLSEFEAAQDSYWTDRVISVPEEKAFLGNMKKTNVPIEAAPDSGLYVLNSGSENFTMVNSSMTSNNKIMEESSPAALILNFSDADSIPSEANLNQIFNHYGPLATSETEVLRKSKRCKVVFKRRADADAAFSSSGKFQIFGPSLVSYRLNYHPVMGKPSSPAKKQRGEQEYKPCASVEPEERTRNGKFNPRKNLAWDSAFFTSAGILDPDELSDIVERADSGKIKHLLPGIQEELNKSIDLISTFESDNLTSESLEADLFFDIRASIQRPSKASSL